MYEIQLDDHVPEMWIDPMEIPDRGSFDNFEI